jgi:hypothetical protein
LDFCRGWWLSTTLRDKMLVVANRPCWIKDRWLSTALFAERLVILSSPVGEEVSGCQHTVLDKRLAVFSRYVSTRDWWLPADLLD